jgi:hypothetical protein
MQWGICNYRVFRNEHDKRKTALALILGFKMFAYHHLMFVLRLILFTNTNNYRIKSAGPVYALVASSSKIQYIKLQCGGGGV